MSLLWAHPNVGGRETNVESLDFQNLWGGSRLLYLRGGSSLALADFAGGAGDSRGGY